MEVENESGAKIDNNDRFPLRINPVSGENCENPSRSGDDVTTTLTL